MSRAVIVSATRTAIGTFGGALRDTSATALAARVIAEALTRAECPPDEVDEVVLGNVLSAGLGLNFARSAALDAGLPQQVPSFAINKACGSGLKAVALAAQSIACGDAEIVVAGGSENMSASPFLLKKARYGYRLGNDEVLDAILADGLTCPITHVHMGITAENIAEQYGITREAQDEFAANSQRKTAEAIASGAFRDEICAVELPQRRGDPIVFDTDEHPKPGSDSASMAKLRPAFKKDGSVTAANASGINDGAAALVVMSEERARASGRTPLAVIRGAASVGVDPATMGLGPVPACERLLKKTGLAKSDIGLWELNEAFAAQSLGVLAGLDLDPALVNVNGGAIALGHPIGASGARVLVTLLFAMQKRDVEVGVASLCIGGGQGIALAVERQ